MCASTWRWRWWPTQLQRGDVDLVKVLENRVVLCVVLPVLAQPAQEVVLLIVVLLYDLLRKVHDSIAQQLVRGVQVDHALWKTLEQLVVTETGLENVD